MSKRTRPSEGIAARHARTCASRNGADCNCRPSWQAAVWSAREKARIRKTFPTLAAARRWRADALVALRKGTMKAPSPTTLREAAEAWLAGARQGAIRTRSGDVYKPSAIRSYASALDLHILPALGARKLHDITRADVQDVADRLLAAGRDPSTVRNALMPLRVIFRRAVQRGEVAVNPTLGLELPAVRGKRDRIAPTGEAARLIAALPERDRALWATALYAGLRSGEIGALRWSDVDLASRVIRVERSWDWKEGAAVEPKSRSGARRVPMAAVLRGHLVEHRMRATSTDAAPEPDALVFGRTAELPFDRSSLRVRALKAWAAAGLKSIGLHEARHTFASLMIAADVGPKAISTYMGHANISITLDRYGHMLPGNENESAALFDAFLARDDTAARLAALDGWDRA